MLPDEPPTPETEGISEPPGSAKPPVRTRRQNWKRVFKIIGGIFLGLFLCFCALMAVGYWWLHHWPKPNGDLDTWDFGKSGANGVTVPFTSPDGVIYIQGYIGKRPTQFTVDTGASDGIIPKRLHLGVQYANDAVMGDALGSQVWAHPVFLPSIRIGETTISNFAAIVPDRNVSQAPIASGSTVDHCTLGSKALSHVVVTIDYVRQRITFQPPQKQVLPYSAKPLYPTRFTWPNGDTCLKSGAPFIRGWINHHRLDAVLDTGTVAPIVIPASLGNILIREKCLTLTGRKAGSKALFSSGSESETTPLTISLGADGKQSTWMMTTNAQIAPGWLDPTCVLIGQDNFGMDIVTIDYPHRTVTIGQSDALVGAAIPLGYPKHHQRPVKR